MKLDAPRRRRDATRVIYEILHLAKGGATKTKIVYQVNLNFRLVQGYVDYLVAKDLVTQNPRISPKTFDLTQKGQNFLQALAEVEEELNDFFPLLPEDASPTIHRLDVIDPRLLSSKTSS